MGLFGKKEEEGKQGGLSDAEAPAGKYDEPCSICNKAPCDKHWGGQYFHKKCFRKLRKGASKMI